MYFRELRVSTGSRIGALVLGTILLIAVGVFLAFGFVLLIGLAVAGLLLGVGATILRRLTGRTAQRHEAAVGRRGLDPSLEVRPPPAGTSLPASARDSTPDTRLHEEEFNGE